MKIYTKTGDKGETGIIGKRVKKNSVTIETLGSLDEFNASLGVAIMTIDSRINELKAKDLKKKELAQLRDQLVSLQSDIFSIGAVVAGGKIEIDFDTKTMNIETEIDKLDETLTPLLNFILPGGTRAAASVHFARTLCRRAERSFVNYEFMLTNEELYTDNLEMTKFKNILRYLNRLSDYLFTVARYINNVEGVQDVLWKKEPGALDLFSNN
jgi:cob(I)alamin adenosyltransferase